MPNLLTKQFPRISRLINERDLVSIIFAVVIMFCAIFIVSSSILGNLEEKKELEQKKELLVIEKRHWEDVVTKYPDYRDGFLNLASVEYRLGNKKSAKDYAYLALEIDPNYKEAKEFVDFLKRE